MTFLRLLIVGVVAGLVGAPIIARAQSAPKLTKAQREVLEAVIAAVDAPGPGEPAPGPAAGDVTWLTHVMRASDGSHYVAVKGILPGEARPVQPVVLYVRLAHRGDLAAQVTPPRSAIVQWLKGQRSEPLPMQAARSTTVNPGEMPIGGTAASVGDVGADATAALRLVVLKREREARLKEDEAARRREALERAERAAPTALFPFEDFDPAAVFSPGPGGLHIARGITAAPGEYELVFAWAAIPGGKGAAAVPKVLRHRLTLPAARPEFQLADLVVASTMTALPAPYGPREQASHPYAFGAIEVEPAARNRLSADGSLGVVYQVVGATGTAAGTPDVEVGLQVFRRVDDGPELPFVHLETQRHHAGNLPGGFDVAQGHPLFGAVRAPLASFPRGRYRLRVTAIDRLAARRTSTDTTFEVIGTPASLLREAPALGQPFRRASILGADVLASLAERLTPQAPSAGLARLLSAAAAGRYAALIQAETVRPEEHGTALALRALGLFGLGDSPVTVGALLQQALAQGAAPDAVDVLRGAVAAASGDDRGAVAAWTRARSAGRADDAASLALLDALLRLGRVDEAQAMAVAAQRTSPDDEEVRRRLAAVHLAAGRYREALTVLDAQPPGRGADVETDFLRLYALFALATRPPATAADRERFRESGARYVAGAGRHAALVSAWLDVVPAGTAQ